MGGGGGITRDRKGGREGGRVRILYIPSISHGIAYIATSTHPPDSTGRDCGRGAGGGRKGVLVRLRGQRAFLSPTYTSIVIVCEGK